MPRRCEREQSAFGRLVPDGAYKAFASKVKSAAECAVDKSVTLRKWKYYMKLAIRAQKAADNGKKFVEREERRVAGKGPRGIGRKGLFGKEGRVAENGVERCVGGIKTNVGLHHLDALGKRAVGHIFPGLGGSIGVNLDGHDVGLRIALRHHKGYQPRARTDVEQAPAALYSRPCAQEDTVGAHLHRTAVVGHAELLETEHLLAHRHKVKEYFAILTAYVAIISYLCTLFHAQTRIIIYRDMNEENIQNPFSFIADFEGDISQLTNQEVPPVMPILPLRNLTLFPCVMSPLRVTRKSSLKLVKRAFKTGEIIGAFSQINSSEEDEQTAELFNCGVAARVVKLLEMPDGGLTVILQAAGRLMLDKIISVSPVLTGEVTRLQEFYPEAGDMEFSVLVEACRKRAIHYIETNEDLPNEAKFAVLNISNVFFMINFLCTSLPLPEEDKREMLRLAIVKERTSRLVQSINSMQGLVNMKNRILQQTHVDLNQQQREWFLQQEMKNIQDELGGSTPTKDSERLRAAIEAKTMPQYAKDAFYDGLSKLERINPQSPDYNVELNYLQTILALPWEEYTKDNLNITNAERVLNHDHYGMDKVKERILEHLAILKLRGDMKSPILCLYGPPGVGKTSLGRSIAEALKRKYVRASLGGLHDEAEIRGHRRTYIGAMPGRVLKNIIKAGSNNPVFILDEIDKIGGMTVNGDPSSALLEVLDPEQNSTFHDNYLDMDYDLSKVMFIATANDISQVPRPLLDRMELIELTGYCTEEKIEIARKHLIKKAKEANGLKDRKDVKMTKAAIEFVIEHYTRESGVRGLEKQLNKIFRKIALNIARDEAYDQTNVDVPTVVQLLGKEPYNRDIYQGNGTAGVVTGLAWTSVGGEILFIETSLSKGQGGRLTITCNLGDVMKESAMLALEYIKAHAEQLKIDPRIFEHWNIHLHVPEGATPKDGPSAGITMATSMASALTQRKVRHSIAMTGEITLRGKVLPVGGIKEKILAAKRAGIHEIIICQDNRKDIEEIPEMYLRGVSFHYVETVRDVFDYALLQEKVKDAVTFEIEEKKD